MSAISTSLPSEWARARKIGPVRRWGLFAVGLVATVAGVSLVTNSRLFDVRELRISGNDRLSSAEVSAAAGLNWGTNVLWMSTESIEARLEANPWIREAHVARTLPDVLEVTVVEQTPVAVVSPGSLLVARDGTVLGKAGGQQAALPRVELSGPPPKAGEVLRSSPQLVVATAMPADVLPVVGRIGSGPNGTLEVTTRDGVPVRFGDQTEASAKWEALRSVVVWAERNAVQAVYIDVRSPLAPALKPASSPAQEPMTAG